MKLAEHYIFLEYLVQNAVQAEFERLALMPVHIFGDSELLA